MILFRQESHRRRREGSGMQTKTPPNGGVNIKCVCHTSLKLRVALLRVNCSASACHPKRHRREGSGMEQKQTPPNGGVDIKCVCHTSLKLRVALLRVNCSASACHPKRHRREGWLGRTDSNHDKENQNLLSYH